MDNRKMHSRDMDGGDGLEDRWVDEDEGWGNQGMITCICYISRRQLSKLVGSAMFKCLEPEFLKRSEMVVSGDKQPREKIMLMLNGNQSEPGHEQDLCLL